jgi:hypothetical protein
MDTVPPSPLAGRAPIELPDDSESPSILEDTDEDDDSGTERRPGELFSPATRSERSVTPEPALASMLPLLRSCSDTPDDLGTSSAMIELIVAKLSRSPHAIPLVLEVLTQDPLVKGARRQPALELRSQANSCDEPDVASYDVLIF